MAFWELIGEGQDSSGAWKDGRLITRVDGEEISWLVMQRMPCGTLERIEDESTDVMEVLSSVNSAWEQGLPFYLRPRLSDDPPFIPDALDIDDDEEMNAALDSMTRRIPTDAND